MCGGSEANVFAATSATVRSSDRKVYHLVDWNRGILSSAPPCHGELGGTVTGMPVRKVKILSSVCEILSCFKRREYLTCVDGAIPKLESQS
jgi:hypothetical protein